MLWLSLTFLLLDEEAFGGSADWAGPFFRHLFEACSRGNPVAWVSIFWVVDVAADGALVSVHGSEYLCFCLIKLVKIVLGFGGEKILFWDEGFMLV